MQAAEIHARVSWPAVLAQLGIPENALRNKHGPCPVCGGKDRFRFDGEKRGRGSFICSHCGAGDGFRLLQLAHGWDFIETRKRVMEAAGLTATSSTWTSPAQLERQAAPAMPSDRVRTLRQGRCAVADCDEAVEYLSTRGLWPLPEGCGLSAHASAEYWNGPQRIGRYAALLADVLDVAGELVTVHITYLQGGKKLEIFDPDSATGALLPPRKILGPLTDRTGCAVRLLPAGDALGIAEGIETALSASALDGIPAWAALNTSLLAKFEPPPQTQRLALYADNDLPGMTAGCRLLERLQDRIRAGLAVEVRIPPSPANDWNDSLQVRNCRQSGERVSP